jgi:hypothetical protein
MTILSKLSYSVHLGFICSRDTTSNDVPATVSAKAIKTEQSVSPILCSSLLQSFDTKQHYQVIRIAAPTGDEVDEVEQVE